MYLKILRIKNLPNSKPNHFLKFFLIICQVFLVFQLPAQNAGMPDIKGIWLGELVVPGQVRLRMGVIVTLNQDTSYKAALNIIDQATGDIPIEEVILRNDTVTFSLKQIGIVIEGPMNEKGDMINCEFRQGGAVFPLDLSRVDKLPELLRPQEPKGPFPYKSEEVIVENITAGIKLSGTLTLPVNDGIYPAVVLITGSGKQNRDEEFARHKPFWVIADYLTRNGVIVLRCDDRGVGGSSGNFDMATTGDFADDALSAIAYLKTRKEVNVKEIGIIGHSEGGIAASVAAANSADVAFIVSLAGFYRNFGETAIEQMLDQSRLQGKNPMDIELEKNWRTEVYKIAGEKTDSLTAATKLWEAHNKLTEDEIRRLNWPKGRQEAHIRQILNPWWRYSLALDNRTTLMNVNCPILALYGEKDVQVKPDENIPFVEEALKNGGNTNFEIRKLPGLNHLFQTASTGLEYEYVRNEETISPAVLTMIADWIGRTTTLP
jgi:pimeloyl-ACP methyl ester carboxylesterase